MTMPTTTIEQKDNNGNFFHFDTNGNLPKIHGLRGLYFALALMKNNKQRFGHEWSLFVII